VERGRKASPSERGIRERGSPKRAAAGRGKGSAFVWLGLGRNRTRHRRGKSTGTQSWGQGTVVWRLGIQMGRIARGKGELKVLNSQAI